MARFPLAVRHLQALAALTALAAFLRFSTLGTQSYWYDEAVTVQLVRRSLSGMLSAIPGSESTPPLYYVLAWGWSRLFGTGDVGLRSLSAVFGTATVPAAYAAARVFVSRRTSLVAAALLAVSPFLVWYSQEARAYAVFVFFGTLSLALVGRAADPSASRSLAWWALSAALALATHYFALFLVAPEAAWLLYRSVDRRATVKAVAIVAAVGAALLPLALYQSRYTEHTAWISTGGLGGRAAYLLHQLVIGAYPTSYIRPLIVAVPVVVSVGLFAWTERSERDGALLALAFGIVAVGAPFALALVGDLFFGGRGDYFLFRNLIVATVPLTIVAATVLGTERAGKAGLLACALVCSLLVAVSIDISRRPDLQRPDVRAVAAAVGSPPGLRAILLDPRTSLPLRLYLPRLEDLRQQGAYLREIDVVEETNNANSPQADRSPPPGFRRIETRHVVQGFTIVRLQSLRRRRVTAANLVGEFPNHRFLAILLAPRD
jgi:mannosyltransferase